MPNIGESKVLIMATDGFEDAELMKPRQRLIDKGAKVVLASLDTDEIEGAKGATVTPDCSISDVSFAEFDALLLPGGTKNPDKLRMDKDAVALVKRFVEAGKPVGAICHAPWLLIEAKVVEGKKMTSWPSVRTDLENAGATVVDHEAVTDGNIVTSRNPDDIPAFTDAFIKLVESAEATLETA